MKIDDFALYFLARLTKAQCVIDLNDKNSVIISIPSNYKDTIEDILNSNDSWKEEFSCLIDMEEYFMDHYAWEKKFAVSLEKIFNILGKKAEYNLQSDTMNIRFTKEEAKVMLEETDNPELNSIMDHFVNLVQAYEYTRDYKKFKENFDASVLKMKKIFGIRN